MITIPTSVPLIVPILQILIALGLFNVWLVRFKKSTAYRGGTAQTLPEEFAAYGLPGWSVYVIGFFKITIAILMIVTVAMPSLLGIGIYALALLVILMIGAISMHIKVKDPLTKMLPALGMLGMAVVALGVVLL